MINTGDRAMCFGSERVKCRKRVARFACRIGASIPRISWSCTTKPRRRYDASVATNDGDDNESEDDEDHVDEEEEEVRCCAAMPERSNSNNRRLETNRNNSGKKQSQAKDNQT